MKTYALIDMTTGDDFEKRFNTEKEAVKWADYEWSIMTDYDKKRRTFFAVMLGEINDEDSFELESAKLIKQYK